MRKSSRKRVFRVLFWLCISAGALWLALVPPFQQRRAPVSVHVQQPESYSQPVQPSQPAPETAPVYEEKQTHPVLPPAVTVPVVPEKETAIAKGHRPKIAIIIDDVGPDLRDSERATHLPAPITLSFLPYAPRLRDLTKQARDNGHELMLHMPMEPLGHEDPGPGALLVDLPEIELRQRFETALASFAGFDGVNNHMGSKFTADKAGMGVVVDELKQRDLFFLDSRTNAQSVAAGLAKQGGVPTLSRDVFLDDDQAPELIREQLRATERVATHKGYAIAIGHPHPATLDALNVWIPDVEKRGFELVPVKQLIFTP